MNESIFVEMPFGRLHGIKKNEGSKVPILFVHGMLGEAEDWLNDFKEFKDHPCYAITLRGRGKSAFPKNENEFSIEDHINDIEAFVTKNNLNRFILVGFSQGVLYSIAYALRHKDKIMGLVIQEKTVSQRKFGEPWVERAASRDDYKSKVEVLKGLAHSSQELDLLPQCEVFKETPVLILKGGTESMISPEELERMKQVFKNSKSIVFEESGHDISSPDYDFYINTMKDFLKDF